MELKPREMCGILYTIRTERKRNMKSLDDKDLKQVTGGADKNTRLTYVKGYKEGESCPDCGIGTLKQAFLPHMLECDHCKHSFEKDED